MASVAANGITLEFDERGAGEPLLLVMGLGGQLTDWPDEFVDLLADQGFRVIRFDNRDAGLSTEFTWTPPPIQKLATAMVTRRPPHAEYRVRDMADDAVGLLDALKLESAHVVGMSMGGMIVQTMAIHHPRRVRSMTSIMSNTGDRRHGRPAPALLARIARLPPPSPETALDRSLAIYRMIAGEDRDLAAYRMLAEANIARSYRPAGVGRQTAAVMASPDRTVGLRQVTAPTLVVHGLLDPLVKPSGGMATAAAVRDSRLVMYPEMGHDLPRRRWPEMVAAIARNAHRAA